MRLLRLPVLLLASILLGMPLLAVTTKEPVLIRHIAVTTSETDGTIDMSLDKPFEPIISWVADDSCWRLDMPGVAMKHDAKADGALFSNEYHGPLRQIWQGQVHAEPPVQRFNLYVTPGSDLKLVRTKSGFSVRLKAGSPGGAAAKRSVIGLLPEPLLLPGHGGGAVEIDVKRSPVVPLLSELAGRAGITLRLRDDPPAMVSFRTRSDSAMNALERLSKRLGMVLTHEGGDWWLSMSKNPLLKLPGDGQILPAEFKGVTVKDALHRLGGRDLGRRLCMGLSKEQLGRMTASIPERMSPRALAQYLQGVN